MTLVKSMLAAALAGAGLLLQALPAQPLDGLRERASEANRAGVEAYEARRFDEAIAQFEQARQWVPGEGAFTRNLARAYHARGVEHRGAKRLREAEEDGRVAAGLEPAEPVFSHFLAGTLIDLDRLGEARSMLLHARARSPEAPAIPELLGRLDYLEEDLDEAVRQLDAALALHSEPPAALLEFHAKVKREAAVERGFYKDVRGPFIVKFDDREFRGVGLSLLGMLDRISRDLRGRFAQPLPGRLTVVLYTREDYASATLAHGWTGALYDGKIRLPVRNFASAGPLIEATLAHEMTHWFIRSAAPRCPLWLNEGLAQMAEGGPAADRAVALLRRAKSEKRLVPLAAIPEDWASIADGSLVALYYAQSLAFTRFLRDRYGDGAIRELLDEFRTKQETAAAVERVFHRSLADLEADWLDTL